MVTIVYVTPVTGYSRYTHVRCPGSPFTPVTRLVGWTLRLLPLRYLVGPQQPSSIYNPRLLIPLDLVTRCYPDLCRFVTLVTLNLDWCWLLLLIAGLRVDFSLNMPIARLLRSRLLRLPGYVPVTARSVR